jgi:[NiFe] hydrogenase diaphorase moiety small subunit
MSDSITFIFDGQEIEAARGQTIIEAADAAGLYVPRLCHKPGLEPFGACRLCTVKVNGRPASACTQPAAQGMVVESETEELNKHRKTLLEMMFVEGNHFCMSCEKSGNCELQAMGYRFGVAAPRFDFLWPERQIDMSHPDVLIDHNRCIQCGRCVRASRDLDGKSIFGFVGRGPHKRIEVSANARLGDTDLEVTDEAVDACPVGAILKKRVGFAVPVGERKYDHEPIGSEIEATKEK